MPDLQPQKTVSSPKSQGGRRRGGTLNLILIVGIIAAIALFVWAEQQRRATEGQLEQTSAQLEEIRKSTQRGGQELAQEVLGKIRAHMVIPEEPEPTVATIVDIDRLKEANDFYSVAENGDHLIITESRAILYDPDNDIILDVVPVQINRDDNQADDSGTATSTPRTTSPSPEATPEPTPDTSAIEEE